jgi:endonuclease I
MKRIFTLTILSLLSVISFAQLSITNVSTAFTENFDAIGNSATATFASTGFKIGTDWATGTTATGFAAGTSGTGVITGSMSGGIYNFANGVTASSTDRSLGFLFSGSYGPTRNITLKITNNSTYTLTDLAIAFDYEKYRSGSREFNWTFNHGYTTTTTGTEVLGNQNYPADGSNTVVSNPPLTVSKSFTLTGLNIPAGTDYYLKWTYAGVGGGSNSQGIGIDNFSVTAAGTFVADVTAPIITTLTPLDNATGVSIGTNLQAQFNEAIAKGTGNIYVKKISDGSTVYTIDITTPAVTVSTNIVSISLPSVLAYSTDYYVEIDGTAFTDISLNAFAGISGNTTWNFTTVAQPAAGIIGNNYGFTNCATTFINEGWSQYSVLGTAQSWICVTPGRAVAPDNAVQMNAFVSSGNNPLNEDWLISPVFDLSTATAPTLKFYSKGDFNGNTLQLKISNNYIAGTNPNTATWTNLNGAFPTNVAAAGVWTLSDNIDLSAYNTTGVNLAWVYVNPTTANSTKWTIDDVSIYSGVVLPACDEPTDQPTNLSLTSSTFTINGTFTAVIPAPSSYLVVRSTSPTLSALPVDGTSYTVAQTLGGGTVVANTTANTFTDNGLAANTTYYYFVFASNSENCTGGPNYNIVLNAAPTGNTNSVATLPLSACIEPSGAPSALILSASNSSISGTFTALSTTPLANRYLIIMSTNNSLSATPTDGVTYTVGSSFGGGTVISFGNTTSFTTTSLLSNTIYYFYIFSANSECTGEPDYYITSSLNNNVATSNGTGVPIGYYDAAVGLTCQPLKTAVKNIISTGYTTLSYTPGLWNLYPYSDKRRNDANTADILWDMYSDNPTGPEPYTYTLTTNQCGNYTGEGGCYNREHSTPQSWFAQLSPMVSDAHHIFPTDGKVNAMHSNYPYGEVTTLLTQSGYTNPSLAGSKLGTGTNNFGYTGTVFEPIDIYKGDFARAILYMAVRYEDEIISQNWASIPNSSGNAVLLSTTDQTDPTVRRLQIYDDWYLKLMFKWHNQDPVSQKEIDRNNVIYAQLITDGASQKKQGNRNPFIDHPEYVAAIWGNACIAGLLPVDFVDFTAQKNTSSIDLKWNIANEININRYEVERSINGIEFETISTKNSTGQLVYNLVDNKLPNATLVFYRIKGVDNDGSFKYSKIVSVRLNSNKKLLLYPNPASTVLNINLKEIVTQKTTIQITDAVGKIIHLSNIAIGANNFSINTTTYLPGKYFIKIISDNAISNDSFMIVK